MPGGRKGLGKKGGRKEDGEGGNKTAKQNSS